MFEIKITAQFKKDLKRVKKRGLKIELLKNIIIELENGRNLAAKYRDHCLIGNWSGHRECHIQPDWILIYSVKDGYLILERTGTHSDLFSKI